MAVCSDWATATLQIPQGQPVWRLELVGISSPVTPGQYAAAQLRVSNVGSAPGQVTVTGDTYDLAGVRQGGWTTATVQLQPGQSQTVNLQSLGAIDPLFSGQTLRAVFRAGDASVTATFQVGLLAPSGVQAQVTVPPGSTTAVVNVSWGAVRGASTYEAQLLSSAGTVLATVSTAGTQAQFTNVPLGQQLMVRVRACV